MLLTYPRVNWWMKSIVSSGVFLVTFSLLLTKNLMDKFRTHFSAARWVKYKEVFHNKSNWLEGGRRAGFESKTVWRRVSAAHALSIFQFTNSSKINSPDSGSKDYRNDVSTVLYILFKRGFLRC